MFRAISLAGLVAVGGQRIHMMYGTGGSSSTSAVADCDFTRGCNSGNNLISVTDFANAAWTKLGSGAAAPAVSAATSATVDGVSLAYNRIQFAAVASGQESSVYQRLGGTSDYCQNKTCTFSIYLRSHSGASVTSGNLPIATAGNGNDGTNYQLCPFTTEWSRCVLTFYSNTTDTYSYFWVGYVQAVSGTSDALDLDIGGPKAEYGAGGATAFQCPSPLQGPAVQHSGYALTQIDDDWDLVKRDGAGLVATSDGVLVMTGGWSESTEATWGGNRTTNQVYKSLNGGATWSLVLAHTDSPGSTRWGRRHSHCNLTANFNGQEYIYIIGGDGFDDAFNASEDGNPPYPRDVWRSPSSSYGATWEKVTDSAEWGATTAAADGGYNGRTLQSCWADGSGNLYVAGGQTSLLVAGALNDVWKSTNGGANWTRILAAAPWAARGTIANALPRFQGRNWLAGGMQYDSTAGNRVHFNDVWNTDDGKSWVQASSGAQWNARGYPSLLAWNGRLWLIKGVIGAANQSDVWSSDDGKCWRPERDAEGWPSHAVSVAPFSTYLVVTGSATSPGVWRLTPP